MSLTVHLLAWEDCQRGRKGDPSHKHKLSVKHRFKGLSRSSRQLVPPRKDGCIHQHQLASGRSGCRVSDCPLPVCSGVTCYEDLKILAPPTSTALIRLNNPKKFITFSQMRRSHHRKKSTFLFRTNSNDAVEKLWRSRGTEMCF